MKQASLKLILNILLMGFFSSTCLAQIQRYHRIEASVSKEQLKNLMKDGLEIDHFQYKRGLLMAEVSDDDIKLLKKKKVRVKYIIEDIEKNLTAYNPKIDREAANSPILHARTVSTPANFGTGGTYGTAGGITKHFTFQEMQNELDDMRALYPRLDYD